MCVCVFLAPLLCCIVLLYSEAVGGPMTNRQVLLHISCLHGFTQSLPDRRIVSARHCESGRASWPGKLSPRLFARDLSPPASAERPLGPRLSSVHQSEMEKVISLRPGRWGAAICQTGGPTTGTCELKHCGRRGLFLRSATRTDSLNVDCKAL